MTPGLIDCHTHLVYGGNRVEEFEKRLCGVSYEEIARAGGGIQSTVRPPVPRRPKSCRGRGQVRAQRLDVGGRHHHRSEVRLRPGSRHRAAHARGGARSRARAAGVDQDDISRAACAAAGICRDRRAAFVDEVSGPWLESLAAAGLVDAVDAFCENIAFTARGDRDVPAGRRRSWDCARTCMPAN